MATYYVTKYALTKGILKVEGELSKNCSDMIVVKGNSGMNYFFYLSDWYQTLDEAQERVGDMIGHKKLALQRQLRNLEKEDKFFKVTNYGVTQKNTEEG